MAGHVPTIVEITVASGEGSATKSFNGNAIAYAIIPPNEAVSYDVEIYRIDPNDSTREYPRSGRTGLSGTEVIQEEFQAYPNMKIYITNATGAGSNGTYYVEVSYKE